MKYLVSHQGQESGPLSMDEIVGKVRCKELELFDYIYDEMSRDWVLLMEHPDVATKLKANKPSAPPRPAVQAAPASQVTLVAQMTPANVNPAAEQTLVSAPRERELPGRTLTQWYVLKGENRFGPFLYADMVKMLQQKILFPFDFIWHDGLGNWTRLAEISEFTEGEIRNLHQKTPGTGVFVKRQYPRKKYGARVLIHDNQNLWKGEGFEISKGGIGVRMKNSLIVPGQELILHLSTDGEWPALNAKCEVVSKKFVSDLAPVEYGLRFLSLSPDVQEAFFKKLAR